MSDLDDKLREIREILEFHSQPVTDNTRKFSGRGTENIITDIKQVFAEEQVKLRSEIVMNFIDRGYMTGQEWYDRFYKELWQPPEVERTKLNDDGESHDRFFRVSGQHFMYNRALDAAKRAAGLDQKSEPEVSSEN